MTLVGRWIERSSQQISTFELIRDLLFFHHKKGGVHVERGTFVGSKGGSLPTINTLLDSLTIILASLVYFKVFITFGYFLHCFRLKLLSTLI